MNETLKECLTANKEGNLMIFGYNIGLIFSIYFGASWYAVLGSVFVFLIMNFNNFHKLKELLK